MQKFKYTAADLNNQRVKGVFLAKDEKELADRLAKQGLYLVSSKAYQNNTAPAFPRFIKSRMSLEELTGFCRQFSVMQNTHVPILECLDVLRNQHFSAYFTSVLHSVYNDVMSGVLLSSALEKHRRVFPDFFRSMIYVGEMSGRLDLVLTSLADYYEKDFEIRRKIKGAMAYPLMLSVMTVGVLVLMLAFVVPAFRSAMEDMNVVPTGLTRVVYDLSDLIASYWHLMIVAAVTVVILGYLISKSKKGRYFADLLKFKLPIIRNVQTNMMTARFAKAFGLLLSSGMDLDSALDAVEVVFNNVYIKKKFHSAAQSVRRGISLADAFEMHGLFPKTFVQMITVGERSASLDEVLMRSCSFFESGVENSLNKLTSKIQPLMLIVLGVIIGALFIAVYSPMLSIMNNLGV